MPLEIDAADLSVRAMNALKKAGFKTIEECIDLELPRLLKMRNVGRKTAQEIFNLAQTHLLLNPDLSKTRGNTEVETSELTETRRDYLACILRLPLKDLFSSNVRAANVLNKLGLKYLRDLVVLTDKHILDQENSGKGTLAKIVSILQDLDLKLKMKLPDALQSFVIEQTSQKLEMSDKSMDVFRSKYPDKAKVVDAVKTRFLPQGKVEFYKKCFDLYKEGGTLDYVGQKIGLTRERARQILVQGTKYGLFSYKGHDYPYFSKEELLNVLQERPMLTQAGKKLNISANYLKRLLVSHGIKQQTIEQFYEEFNKRRTKEQYQEIVKQLGHDPTTTELQVKSGWRYLSMKISRLWGSIDSFREELKIPKPPQGNPRFRDDTKEWRENRMRLAFIKRMQKLDDVRETLESAKVPMTAQEIYRKTGIKYVEVGRFLNILINTGEIGKVGKGNRVSYKLTKGA